MMEREKISDCLKVTDSLEKALEGLPYRDAAPAIRRLVELRGIICESLPGGELLGRCDGCEAVLGVDDPTFSDDDGDVCLCGDCVKGRQFLCPPPRPTPVWPAC